MTGIEILATNEIIKNTFNLPVFIIGMIIIIATVIFLTWKCLLYDEDRISTIIIVLMTILLFTIPVAVIADSAGEKTLDHIEYKVQLSDEVPIAEFLSTYQIIDQEEQILTIMERTGD